MRFSSFRLKLLAARVLLRIAPALPIPSGSNVPGHLTRDPERAAAYLADPLVHHVISPESDAGRRVAHLVNGRLLDYIEFDDGFAIVKINPPRETIGFTLEQSQIRRKYGVTVVGVKAPGEDFTYAVPATKVSAHHTLIVSGPTELIERFAARP